MSDDRAQQGHEELSPADRKRLRRLWSQAAVPAPQEDLAECDERTRAAVAWMRGAWTQESIPTPTFPKRVEAVRRVDARAETRSDRAEHVSLPKGVAAPARRRPRLLPIAAAAAAVLAVWFGARLTVTQPGSDGLDAQPAEDLAVQGAARYADPLTGAAEPLDRATAPQAEPTPPLPFAPMQDASRVEALVAEVGPNNLEFRSGSVRLVLVIDTENKTPSTGDFQ